MRVSESHGINFYEIVYWQTHQATYCTARPESGDYEQLGLLVFLFSFKSYALFYLSKS